MKNASLINSRLRTDVKALPKPRVV